MVKSTYVVFPLGICTCCFFFCCKAWYRYRNSTRIWRKGPCFRKWGESSYSKNGNRTTFGSESEMFLLCSSVSHRNPCSSSIIIGIWAWNHWFRIESTSLSQASTVLNWFRNYFYTSPCVWFRIDFFSGFIGLSFLEAKWRCRMETHSWLAISIS